MLPKPFAYQPCSIRPPDLPVLEEALQSLQTRRRSRGRLRKLPLKAKAEWRNLAERERVKLAIRLRILPLAGREPLWSPHGT